MHIYIEDEMQACLTLLNKLARDEAEQTVLREGYRKAWESGDETAIGWLGEKLVEFAPRLRPKM